MVYFNIAREYLWILISVKPLEILPMQIQLLFLLVSDKYFLLNPIMLIVGIITLSKK